MPAMNPQRIVSLALLGSLLIGAPAGLAQGPSRQPFAYAPRTLTERARDEPDPLRPYTPQNPGEPRRYARQGAAEAPRVNFYAQRHNYYPGLRSGQGPNRNVGGSHCVPSRRSFLTPR